LCRTSVPSLSKVLIFVMECLHLYVWSSDSSCCACSCAHTHAGSAASPSQICCASAPVCTHPYVLPVRLCACRCCQGPRASCASARQPLKP